MTFFKTVGEYKKYEISNFDRYEKPSVDRLDDTLGYTLANMRLTNWRENDSKYKDSVKQKVYLFKDGECLGEYESLRALARDMGMNSASVNKHFRNNTCFNGYYFKPTNVESLLNSAKENLRI